MTRNKQGVYLVYKSIGPSSFACVAQMQRLLQADKAGHLGTLDPFAEGLLPIFLNRATRMIPYVENGTKTYRALAALGLSSDSLDVNGRLSSASGVSFDKFYELFHGRAEKVVQALQDFVGVNRQEIPLYSAKKVKGKKMYEYARRQIDLEKQYKTITVEKVQLNGWQSYISAAELRDLPYTETESLYNRRKALLQQQQAWMRDGLFPAAQAKLADKYLPEYLAAAEIAAWSKVPCDVYLDIEFTVSKGAFIRALVHELGRRLQTGACTLRLLRTRIGEMQLEQANSELKWQELAAAGQAEPLSLRRLLAAYPIFNCDAESLRAFVCGRLLTFYPKNAAERPEFSTEYLQKKITNANLSSIIKQGGLLVALKDDEVVGMLRLAVQDSETAAQAEPVYVLKAERMLLSHEDI